MSGGRDPLRIAVVGHVPCVVLATVARLPVPGEIVHLDETLWIPGGGGGVAFGQLVRGPATVELFTAVGSDATGTAVVERLAASGALVHAARREEPHSRDLALVTPDGERTIFVIGAPLQPRRDDPLPWERLAACDAVFFTARDPALVQVARGARHLIVTARRAEALAQSGVEADVVVGSASDPREASTRGDYPVPPRALVMTEGARGGRIETEAGITRFSAAPPPPATRGSYGAGDTFAGALTWYVATGLDTAAACLQASRHGAAVLGSLDPLAGQQTLTWPPARDMAGR